MYPTTEMLIHLSATLLLLNLIGSAIGFFVGNIKPDQKTVVQYISLFMIPPVILAGFIANTGKPKTIPKDYFILLPQIPIPTH